MPSVSNRRLFCRYCDLIYLGGRRRQHRKSESITRPPLRRPLGLGNAPTFNCGGPTAGAQRAPLHSTIALAAPPTGIASLRAPIALKKEPEAVVVPDVVARN